MSRVKKISNNTDVTSICTGAQGATTFVHTWATTFVHTWCMQELLFCSSASLSFSLLFRQTFEQARERILSAAPFNKF